MRENFPKTLSTPRHYRNPDAAHAVWINDDVLPGLCQWSGGVRTNKFRLEQEQRTFTTYTYYSGFVVPSWKATFEIWSDDQYEEVLRLQTKYCPHPVQRLADLHAVQVTNVILNENGFRMMRIMDWTPMAAPQDGRYFYSITFVQAYKVRFIPAPPKDNDKGANVADAAQNTKRAINPRTGLAEAFDDARRPKKKYMTPAATLTLPVDKKMSTNPVLILPGDEDTGTEGQ